MDIKEVIKEPEIQALQARFLEKGIPFQSALQEALDKAIQQQTKKIANPQVQDIVNQVIGILEAQLISCIAQKAESWFQKLIAKIFKKK